MPALEHYLALLTRWNQRINLTGARDAQARVRWLVRPALDILPHVRGTTLLDVGSGNGSPGLVLALIAPQLRVTLLEPRQKRWAFLREAARLAGPDRVRVERSRHDQYQGAVAETVTVRALSLPMEELVSLGRSGGRIIIMGTAPQPCALVKAATGVCTPDLHVYDVVPRETPP